MTPQDECPSCRKHIESLEILRDLLNRSELQLGDVKARNAALELENAAL
jgi:hypothetical protein